MRNAGVYTESVFRYYLEMANISDSVEDGVEQDMNSTYPLEMPWEEWALNGLSALSEYEDLRNQTGGGGRRLGGEKPPSLSAFFSHHPANAAFDTLSPENVAAGEEGEEEEPAATGQRQRHLLAVSGAPSPSESQELEEWQALSIARPRNRSPQQRILWALQEDEVYRRELLGGTFQVHFNDPVSVSGRIEAPNGGLGITCTIANPLEFSLEADVCLTAYPICFDGNIDLTWGSKDFFGRTGVSIDVLATIKKYRKTIQKFSPGMLADVIEILGSALTIEIGFFSYRYSHANQMHTLAGGPKLGMAVGGQVGNYDVSAAIDIGLTLQLKMWRTVTKRTTCRIQFHYWRQHAKRVCVNIKIGWKTYQKCWNVYWKSAVYRQVCSTSITTKQELDFDMYFYISYELTAGFFNQEGTLVNINLLR
jgi:hypothetical protein